MKQDRIKNPQAETRIFNQRIFIAVLIVFFCISALTIRFFYLQVIKHNDLLEQSEKNRIKAISLPPARGLIFDRNGELLVNNMPTYRLKVIPEKVDNLKEKLDELKNLINLTDNELDDFNKKLKLNQPFHPITLKAKLNDKQLSKFMVNKHHYSGFSAEPYLIRHYLYTDILAHVVGYVGRINDKDLQSLDSDRYKGSAYTGKLGIEKYYENLLHGQPGSLIVETNVKGRVLKTLKEVSPISGQDLHLTLDIGLQKKSYDSLGEHTGSVIVMNPNNGEVLAMVSKPGFDPNLFVNGISQKDYSLLINSSEKPLFNRSIKGGYEPGSTIKPYMALVALKHSIIDLKYNMLSKGFFQLPNQERKYHDWKKGGHGQVDIVQSLAQSVNTFYYDLAVKIGIDRIHSFLDQFKFGVASGIDLQGEKTGLLPSRAWKNANKNTIWYPGETVITGIGQGYLTTTPLQLATAVSILANRGTQVTPHLRDKSNKPKGSFIDLPKPFWDVIHQGMIAVVHDIKGTAFAVKPKGYLIAGKSGTSQVYGKKEEDVYEKNDELPKHLRNHALFVAFAPADSPEIAVVVVAEHGHSGSKVAAPIAAEIIDYYMQEMKP
jgi:penicillin-binding protein 2